ncbi:helix-turn-helix domain-containing protein [Pyruvatibacter mobilis]|uniref:helix-turn-helix domain-containing protein n=1 Tax=Pyruvatibacter mobilis TaxID=1712261 RepID=UPI003BAB7704
MTKTLEAYRKKALRDPALKAEYERLGPEFRIARAIIDARKTARLTQADLATRMGTTQSAIARMESGRQMPSTKTLMKVAEATGTELLVEFG